MSELTAYPVLDTLSAHTATDLNPGYRHPNAEQSYPVLKQPVPGIGYPSPETDYPQTNMQPSPCDNKMPMPIGVTMCPPGLEYLRMIDQFLVHQNAEFMELFLGCDSKNNYCIKNSLGQQIYMAKEESSCCARNCAGSLRPFDLKIEDNFGNEVMNFRRDCRCDGCCCPCCLQEIKVMAPPGTVIGSVAQEWSMTIPKFSVRDAAGETILQIVGSCCQCPMNNDVEFKILAVDGESEVGSITRQWPGATRELFTDASHLGVTFPIDLDVNVKVILLGACMLIDYMFYEVIKNTLVCKASTLDD